MKAVVRRVEGLSLVGKAGSNHWVPMDVSTDAGGTGAATSPMELVLLALGGCSAVDVLSIMRKKRVKLDDYEVEIEADRAEEHPRVFTAIRVVHRFYGDGLKRTDLDLAVRLSEETYCSVSAMLRRSTEITTTVEMHPPRRAYTPPDMSASST